MHTHRYGQAPSQSADNKQQPKQRTVTTFNAAAAWTPGASAASAFTDTPVASATKASALSWSGR